VRSCSFIVIEIVWYKIRKISLINICLCRHLFIQLLFCILIYIYYHNQYYFLKHLLLLNAIIYIPDCFHIIASKKNNETAKTALVKDLVLLSCEYFSDYARCTVHLTSAENLVRVMQVLSNFVPTEAEPRRNIGMYSLFIELIYIHFLTLVRRHMTGHNYMCI
jgi:hypothetical protein